MQAFVLWGKSSQIIADELKDTTNLTTNEQGWEQLRQKLIESLFMS